MADKAPEAGASAPSAGGWTRTRPMSTLGLAIPNSQPLAAPTKTTPRGGADPTPSSSSPPNSPTASSTGPSRTPIRRNPLTNSARGGMAVQMMLYEWQSNQAFQQIFQELGAKGFGEQEIWEGDPLVYPVFESHKEELHQLMKPDDPPGILQVNIGGTEGFEALGVSHKVYKIENSKLVSSVIALICKKLGVPNYRKYAFKTMRGYLLDDNEVLGTYGFGTLLKQWELQLVKKSPEEYTKAREKAAKGESYLVTFVLPQLPQFQGLSQRIQKVRGSTPTGDLIKLLCDRYKVATPEQFAIASMDGFIFSRTEGLEYYGLGRKFDNMAVKLVAIVQEKEKQRGRAASVHFNSDYIWTQVDDQLDIKEARAVILDLDKQLGFALDKTSQLRSDMDKLASMLKRTEKAKEAVEAERDHIIGQAKKLIEIYTDVTNQKGQLLEEKGQRMQEIDGLRRQVELQQTSAVQAQFKHESQVMEFEQKLFSVSKELDGEKTRVSALQADLSATQTELSTLQTEKSRLREALQRAITELKTRREVEQQQTTELNALNDEIAQRKFTESQLSSKLATITSERDQLSKTLEETYVEKDSFSKLLAKATFDKEELQRTTDKDVFAKAQLIENLRQEIEKLEEKSRVDLAQLKHTVEERDISIKDYDTKLSVAQYKLDQLQQETSGRISKLQQDLQTQSDEFSQKRRELEKQMAQRLNQAIETKDNIQKEMSDSVAFLQKEREELNAQISAGISEKHAIARDYEAKLKANQEAMSKLEVALKAAEGVVSDYKQLKDQKVNLNNELEQMRTERRKQQDRIAALERDQDSIHKSAQQAKMEFESIRSEAEALKKQLAVNTGSSTSLNSQLAQLQHSLETEQRNAISAQQKSESLEKKVTILERKVEELEGSLSTVTEEKEKLAEQVASGVKEDKDAVRDLTQRVSIIQAEKDALLVQIDQLNQGFKEKLARLEAVPPPPALPVPAAPPVPRSSSSHSPTVSTGSLESQILNIKDTLQKIDKSAMTERKNVDNTNSMAQLIITGLEKRFRNVRAEQMDQIEELGGINAAELLGDDDDW